MGFLNGIGEGGRQARLNEANLEGGALIGKLQSQGGYVDAGDLQEAARVVQLVRSAMPPVGWSSPYERMNWQGQLQGAEMLYNQVRNQFQNEQMQGVNPGYSTFPSPVPVPPIVDPGVYSPNVYNPNVYNPGVYNPNVYNPGVYNPAYDPNLYNPGYGNMSAGQAAGVAIGTTIGAFLLMKGMEHHYDRGFVERGYNRQPVYHPPEHWRR
jgi:hypothetical protein